MILADENIDAHIIDYLRSKGIEVFSVRENYPGITDEQVIALSKDPPRIILTEDKDFGEWVYARSNSRCRLVREFDLFLFNRKPTETKMLSCCQLL